MQAEAPEGRMQAEAPEGVTENRMDWTFEQKQAIDTEGVNILVSAAAGSGKTTVLINRISRLIIENEVDVDRFLITTFTNAAAAEMKGRLEEAILKELEECDGKKEFLQRQISLLPDASIETFHSFSIGMIRDYFFLTDLQPGFTIGDETRVNLMKKDVIDGIFEDRFANDTERFKAFLKKYSRERSDGNLKESILGVYREMLSIPDYIRWAEESVEKLNSPSPVSALGIDSFVREETAKKLKEAYAYYSRAAEILNAPETESLYLKARQDAGSLLTMAGSIAGGEQPKSIDEIKAAIESIKMNQMRASGKEEKAAYEEVKERVKSARDQGKRVIDGIKKKYLAVPSEVADETIGSLYEDTEYFLGIIKQLDETLKERKKDENIIDFDDAMHYAIKILEDDRAAEDYRNRFKYIFIDEYQDSNYLQEKIVERIAGTNNLFMVGDIKQSIYKFRLAEPEIFRDKYDVYRRDEEENSIKIDLNNNFRSKANIRTVVNGVFADVMEGYDDNAALVGPEGEQIKGPSAELHIISKENEQGDGEYHEKATELTEAGLAAEIIKKYVGEEFTDKKGQVRKLTYGDIAVLSRGGAAVSEIERYLNNENIPACGETAGGYYETAEIRIFLDLLKVISNFRQDVPLIGVMSAVFFDFTPMELAKIRIGRKSCRYYCDAVLDYAEHGEDQEIRTKVKDMIEKIALWKEMSRTVPLDELMRMLIYETGYYDYCSSLPAGHRRISNLRLLMERAAAYEETSYMGLFGFLDYVDAMKRSSQKVNEAPVAGEGENTVRVMTVHKSKGLEFPMVILVGAGKKITGRSAGFDPAMHKNFTIGLPLVDRDNHWRSKTLLQRTIAGRKRSEELEEEIRILYVALTRPMDRLVMIGSVSDTGKLGEVPSTGNFMEMIYPAAIRLQKQDPDTVSVHIHDAAGTVASPDWEPDAADGAAAPAAGDPGAGEPAPEPDAEALEAGELEPAPDAAAAQDAEAPDAEAPELAAEIHRRLSYEYPQGRALAIRPKYTVSMLANGYEDQEPEGNELPLEKLPDIEIRSLEKEEGDLTPAQRGTVMHDVMERLDFERAESEGEDYVRTFIEELKRRDILSEAQYEVASDEASVGNIAAFFKDPIGKRAARASGLRKENEFIMNYDLEGEQVVVQGKIDCWFEEEEGLVLIDYKNNKLGRYMDEDRIVEEYINQIKLYAQALEKATDKPVKEAWLYLFRERKFIKM